MKYKKKRFKGQKLVFVLICILLLELAGISLAWLTYWQRLNTISVVQIPSRITISGANRSEMQKISLEMTSDDMQEGDKVTIRRVFCIESTDNFYLEVAHTTNIPDMEIKIFPVLNKNSDLSETTEPNAVKGTDAGKTFYYNPDGTEIAGGYINEDNGIAIQKGNAGTLHPEVYDDGDTVQKNAEPLYWLSTAVEEYDKESYSAKGMASDGKTEIYYRYYVLELRWDVTKAETDMVYLLASHEE